MSALDRQIRAMRRRCNLAIFIARLRLWASLALAVAAMVVLIVRPFWPTRLPWLWLVAILAPLAVALAWRGARARRVTREQAAGWLDARCQAGGLVLAIEAGEPGSASGWLGRAEQVVRQTDRPLPRIRMARTLLTLLVWSAFLAAALLSPEPDRAAPPAPFGAVGGEAIAKLTSKFEKADQLGLLDTQQREELARTIEQLVGEQADAFDQKNWQALDAANQRLDNTLAEARQTLQTARPPVDQARQAMAAGAGLAAFDAQAQQQLASALQKLGNSALANAAPDALKRQLADLRKRGPEAGLPSDPQQLQQLIDNASQFLDQAQQGLGQGNSAQANAGGKFDPSANLDNIKLAQGPGEQYTLGQGDGEGEGQGEGQGPGQGEGDGEGDGEGQGQGNARGNRPGRGGVTRGRGDAPMIWGDQSRVDDPDSKFKPRKLADGPILDPRAGERVGLSIARPDGAGGPAGAGAARNFDADSGVRAVRRDFSPAYRGPIRRYFDAGAPADPE